MVSDEGSLLSPPFLWGTHYTETTSGLLNKIFSGFTSEGWRRPTGEHIKGNATSCKSFLSTQGPQTPLCKPGTFCFLSRLPLAVRGNLIVAGSELLPENGCFIFLELRAVGQRGKHRSKPSAVKTLPPRGSQAVSGGTA